MSVSRSTQHSAALQPSMTAVYIALAYKRALDTGYDYMVTPAERQLIDQLAAAAQKALPASSVNGLLFRGLSMFSPRGQQAMLDVFYSRHYDQVILLRRLMVKTAVERALAAGAKQVVFLGGGFDARAFIAAQTYPNVRFCEIDRGPTRERKLRVIAEQNAYDASITTQDDGTVMVNRHLHYINCDLSRTDVDLGQVLAANDFNSADKTLVVGEGVSMYLSRAEHQRLLASAAQFLSDDSELLLSYKQKAQTSAVASFTRGSSGETHKLWLARKDVMAFVNGAAFGVTMQFSPAEALNQLDSSYLPDAASQMQAAHTGERYYMMSKRALGQYHTMAEVPTMRVALPVKPAASVAPH